MASKKGFDKKKTKGINSRATLNRIKIESMPSFTFSGSNPIIPAGEDNQYFTRINTAIRKSPTALGCVKKQAELIFGNGIEGGHGDIVVNRNGETLNDIVWQCIRHGYSTLYGYALHFNFNILGQISEISFVDIEYLRKHRDLTKVDFGIWSPNYRSFLSMQTVTVDLFGTRNPLEGIKKYGLDYRGQVAFFSKDMEVYPTAPIDSAVISASYEKEAQIYPYANIKNGFSGSTIIKFPTTAMGSESNSEIDELQKNIDSLHGAENTGKSVIVAVQTNMDGSAVPFQLVEHLTPPGIDNLFVNQNAKAERDILKVFNMDIALLGVRDPNGGVFSSEAKADAFNSKNIDSEGDRKAIERYFNKIMPLTVFGISEIKLSPFPQMGKDGLFIKEGEQKTEEKEKEL